ncbi:DUF2817 domain-containing protein [Ornithinimicrobium sp. Arc0846-15]|nr:DUF2817 domain-containing protein [Ornithinimicrobium laminariae]
MVSRRAIPFALALALGITAAGMSATASAVPVTSSIATQNENVGQDAAGAIGLVESAEINEQLLALASNNDRVSTEVIGTSVEGRDLMLVTVTDPAAADDLPVVLFTANLHGNEWEGSDAALQLIEDLATSTDKDEVAWLQSNRVSFVVTANPDGRFNNTRENAAGIDLNRDFMTASQPETQALRDVVIEQQPLALVDLHGYVNGTLVEPTTPPHGENSEFDLLIENSYPLGLEIESGITSLDLDDSADVRDVQIPLREWSDGWDGWPPVFLPQYASLHGTVALTVELPLRTNNGAYDLDQGELDRRSGINIAIADQVMRSTLDYVSDEADSLVANQQAVFDRGAANAEQRPATDLDLGVIGTEDVFLTEFADAYVIPQGVHQRSEPAAARLVDSLLANDVVVTQSTQGFRLDGVAYPAGSYVVPGEQPKRGVAGAMLGQGSDISPRVESMYDVAAWSLADLWGADVIRVEDAADLPELSDPVASAQDTGGLTGAGPWALTLTDPSNVAAMNDLLAADVALGWSPEGQVIIPRDGASVAKAVATTHGIEILTVDAETRDQTTANALTDQIQVAAAAEPGEVAALGQMGFAVTEFSGEDLNDGFAWQDFDVAYVSSDLRWDSLETDAQDDFSQFLADGGGLIAQGEIGADFNQQIDGLDATAEPGPAHANGIVNVTSTVGPIATRATAQTFVYGPVWFTDLGSDVTVDQRLSSNPLLSGHWRAAGADASGPTDARGQALVVHGVDQSGATSGAPIVIFGSDPLFRAHPQGQFPLVGAAIAWTTLENPGEMAR